MARIIYGVAGEGFGHSSRAHLIGQRLIDAGHEVIFVASEKSYSYLKQYFADKVKEITGLVLICKNGNLCTYRTLIANGRRFGRAVLGNSRLFRDSFSLFNPDVVITDFEPFIASWAVQNKIPLLSIDNEHILTHCRLDNFGGSGFAEFSSKLVTKCYRIRAAAHIILSFFEAPVESKSAILAPPVIRSVVSRFTPTSGEHILYYSTDNTNLDKLLTIFAKFPDYRFRIYGFNQSLQYKNCILKRTSTQDFLADLAGCRAVISSAGFSLLSECLHFRKKMLLLPLRGQYEQMVNAHYVQKLNLGFSSYSFDENVLADFLAKIDEPMRPKEQVIWPDNDKFFRILGMEMKNLGLSIDGEHLKANVSRAV